jgi:hypothetical protein
LEQLGSELKPDLAIDVILQSLPASYDLLSWTFRWMAWRKHWLNCMGC